MNKLLGQENVKQRLKSSVINKNVSHACIFEGEDGSGKKTFSEAYSMAIQCEKGTGEPCMECPSCIKALSRNHPDIIHVIHERPNSIGVSEIRDQVVSDVMIKPYSSQYKIYIIAEAEKMTAEAQNALLKTLEEPPSYAVIMLLTNNILNLLPTIISRCVRFRLNPLDSGTVNRYLTEELNVDRYQAEMYTALARGNLGRAKSLIEDESFNAIKDEASRLVKNIRELKMSRLSALVKLLDKNRVAAGNFLDILLLWFRDVLMFKVTGLTDELAFKEEVSEIKSEASDYSCEGLNKAIEAVEEARKRLNANVNFEMTIQLLAFEIRSSLINDPQGKSPAVQEK